MIVLITGANKGIGREIAGRLGALGHTVVIGARGAEAGTQAAEQLRAAGADASSVVLDVTDAVSVAAAAAELGSRFGKLDALVNNAGVSRSPGSDLTAQTPGTAEVDLVRLVFDTNVFGIVRVTEAMLPLLRRSDSPRIVNVTSSAGSLTRMTDPAHQDSIPISVAYAPSKTAATAVTIEYARGLRSENILVNAVCPGYVATDLNNFSGHRTPAQGAAQAVRMATIPSDGPTGTFTEDDGTVPW